MNARKLKGRSISADTVDSFPIGKRQPLFQLPADRQIIRSAPTRWIKSPSLKIAFPKGKR